MKSFTVKKATIFENEDYLILNKPNNFSINDSIGKITIYQSLKKKYKDIKIFSNLDSKVSGIIIFSKSKKAYKNILNQFIKKELYRECHILVKGQHHFKDEIIRKPIREKKNKESLFKTAKTIFKTIKVYKGYTLICAQLLTNRKDQISIHSKYLKLKIIGDKKFGGEDIYLSKLKKNYKLKINKEEFSLNRGLPMIHFYKTKFNNLDNQVLNFFAEYSKEFNIVIDSLNKFSQY